MRHATRRRLSALAHRIGAADMPTSVAHVQTDLASRYLVQLCKHFAHKIPVAYAEDRGRIEFPSGLCTLTAAPDAVTLTAEAADPAALAQLTEVVQRHLTRFAFRQEPTITWRPRS